MRTGQFLIEKNIGFKTLQQICQYLNLDRPLLNAHLSDGKIKLIEKTFTDQHFGDWLKLKLNLQRVEQENAKSLFKNLYYYS